jgi:hypothetical protein
MTPIPYRINRRGIMSLRKMMPGKARDEKTIRLIALQVRPLSTHHDVLSLERCLVILHAMTKGRAMVNFLRLLANGDRTTWIVCGGLIVAAVVAYNVYAARRETPPRHPPEDGAA